MKLTIISDDKKVYQNGISYEINAFDNVPGDIHALQWDSDLNAGWIEFKDEKPNQDIGNLPEWASRLIVEWNNEDEKQKNPTIIPLTTEQLLEKCKYQAQSLLFQTDWAVLPDVGLKNLEEFIAYRGILRGLIVQPQENPNFPVKPQAVWE